MSANVEIPFERLLDWVDGRLSPADAQLVERQLATASAATQTQVRWLRAFVHLHNRVILAAPPPIVRTRVTQHFKQYAHSKRKPGFFQRLAAVLTFDSALHPALA